MCPDLGFGGALGMGTRSVRAEGQVIGLFHSNPQFLPESMNAGFEGGDGKSCVPADFFQGVASDEQLAEEAYVLRPVFPQPRVDRLEFITLLE